MAGCCQVPLKCIPNICPQMNTTDSLISMYVQPVATAVQNKRQNERLGTRTCLTQNNKKAASDKAATASRELSQVKSGMAAPKNFT